MLTALDKYRLLMNYRLTTPFTDSGAHEHHVIPQCIKKSSVTVRLSVQEHTLAHYWLYKHFSRKKKTRQYAEYMRAAYIGLRNSWFGHNYVRWLFQRDKAWKQYEKEAVKKLKSSA